jgi:Ran GTPase-activating protein (RanGAP) involved in mRNA processing and transport
LFIGNNIVGDEGAKLIADFISSGKSTIYIWYIAGNNITSIGLEKITKALQNDTKVTALWLKRNPLKSAGMIPLSELLFTNTSIQVLDLLNCGLLDSGASILFNGLKSNKHLKHLYLSANGITPVGLRSMLDYFETVENSELESLFLGCNRIGNEGAKILGECLRYAPRLERLNLSSSRIGPIGMKYLCEHLNGNQSVKLLELGYMRATMDLGELNNFIEDEGVGYLTQLLASNSTKLTILDISHNLVSQIGFEMLVNMGVKENKSLVSLNCSQFGVHFREDLTDLLKYYLKRNRDSFLQSNSEHIIDEILLPQHVKEIYSVYRTH